MEVKYIALALLHKQGTASHLLKVEPIKLKEYVLKLCVHMQ